MLPPVQIQSMFYGLELLPGTDYKLTAGRDAEVEFTQACLAPSSTADQSAVVRFQQLESDSEEDEDGDSASPAFVVARLSVRGTETKSLKACQISDSSVIISTVGAASVHLTGQLVVDINSDASGVQVEEMVSDAAASSQREVPKPKPGWTPVRLVY